MFNFEKRIYFCDTDAEGIVYHSRYIDFCEQARTEFMIENGLPQHAMLENMGFMYVIRNLNIEYRIPARFEDLINISIDKIEIIGPKIKFFQTITNKKTNKIIVKCDLECVCVDKNFILLKKIPKVLEEKLKLI